MHSALHQFSPSYPSVSDGIGKTVLVHLLKLADYRDNKLYCRVYQIVARNHSLRDIKESHCCALTKSLCKCKLDNERGLMTAYFFIAVNRVGATYDSAVHDVDGKKILKNDYGMVMLDDRNRGRTWEMVRDENA